MNTKTTTERALEKSPLTSSCSRNRRTCSAVQNNQQRVYTTFKQRIITLEQQAHVHATFKLSRNKCSPFLRIRKY